jgi:hypothetical protein
MIVYMYYLFLYFISWILLLVLILPMLFASLGSCSLL